MQIDKAFLTSQMTAMQAEQADLLKQLTATTGAIQFADFLLRKADEPEPIRAPASEGIHLVLPLTDVAVEPKGSA